MMRNNQDNAGQTRRLGQNATGFFAQTRALRDAQQAQDARMGEAERIARQALRLAVDGQIGQALNVLFQAVILALDIRDAAQPRNQNQRPR